MGWEVRALCRAQLERGGGYWGDGQRSSIYARFSRGEVGNDHENFSRKLRGGKKKEEETPK